MRTSLYLAVALAAVSLAACDTSVDRPPDPDVIEWRSLAACLDVPGTPVLFIGGPFVTCLSEAGVTESEFPANGYLGGTFTPFRIANNQLLISLAGFNARKVSLVVNLISGDVREVSGSDSWDSYVERVDAHRFMITDLINQEFEGDSAEFEFRVFEGGTVRVFNRVKTSITDDVGISGAVYNPESNKSTILLIGSFEDQKELEVDHRDGSFVVRSVPWPERFGTMAYLQDGTKLLMSFLSYRIVSDSINGPVAYDFGPRAVAGRPELVTDRHGDVYTFVNEASGARIVRLLPGNRTEDVTTLPRAQRYMGISNVRDVACLREFRPLEGYTAPTYDDTGTIVSLTTGAVLATYRITLDTQRYEAPPFVCL